MNCSLQGAHLAALEASWREGQRAPRAGGDHEPRPLDIAIGSTGGFGAATAERPFVATERARRAGGLEPIQEETADGTVHANDTFATPLPAADSMATSQQLNELVQQDSKRRKVTSRPVHFGTHHEGF